MSRSSSIDSPLPQHHLHPCTTSTSKAFQTLPSSVHFHAIPFLSFRNQASCLFCNNFFKATTQHRQTTLTTTQSQTPKPCHQQVVPPPQQQQQQQSHLNLQTLLLPQMIRNQKSDSVANSHVRSARSHSRIVLSRESTCVENGSEYSSPSFVFVCWR